MATRSQLIPIPLKGWPKGSALDKSLDRIDVDEARYILDAWPNFAPDMPRRGPVTPAAGGNLQITPAAGIAIGWAKTPDGKIRIGIVQGDSTTTKLSVLNDAISGFSSPLTLISSWSKLPFYMAQFTPALHGGTWIGISSSTNIGAAVERLIYWRGASLANYSPGNITATRGSTAVTGVGTTFTTTVEPGMFLFTSGGARYIGVVKSITNNTNLVLESPALASIAAVAGRFQSTRGFGHRVGTGVITVANGSVDVTGSNTKFTDEGLGTGTWELFKKADSTFIGTVTAVVNNQALTLTAGAAIAMNTDEYFAIKTTQDIDENLLVAAQEKPGFITAIYANRQFYANRSRAPDQGGGWVDRLQYSDPDNMEIVNFATVGGDYFVPGSDKEGAEGVRGLVPTTSALVILKHKEVFAVFGDSPQTFEVKRIGIDGALTPMAAHEYKGGAIWAGRQGIYLWDGTEPENLIEGTIQNYYTNLIKSKEPTALRAWATVKRDYFFLTITDQRGASLHPGSVDHQNIPEVVDDAVTICVHIPSKAAVFLSNFPFRGAAEIPHSTGDLWWYLGNEAENMIFNNSFEVNVAQWTATGTNTLSRDNTNSFLKDWAVTTSIAFVNDGLETNNRIGSGGMAVGDTILGSIRVWSPQDDLITMKLNIDEWDGTGHFLAESPGVEFVLKKGWNTFTEQYVLVNAGVVGVHLRLTCTVKIGSHDIWVDYGCLYNLTKPYHNMVIFDFLKLLDEQGQDLFALEREVPGPYLYIETGGISADDPTLKKRWRDILLHYLSDGSTLTVSVGLGLDPNSAMTTLTTPLVASSTWIAKKLRFMKQSQIARFAIRQTNRNHDSVKLGPAEVGFKARRRGVV